MKTITIEDWKSYFPFPQIRPEQEKAINFALNSYINDNKKYVILELGTGVGKSATGIAIARYMEAHGPVEKNEDNEPLTGAYVVTTQKILQEQYLRDFGTSTNQLVKSIKSSNNYVCSFYNDQTCAESKRILSKLANLKESSSEDLRVELTDFQIDELNQKKELLDALDFSYECKNGRVVKYKLFMQLYQMQYPFYGLNLLLVKFQVQIHHLTF